MEVELNHNNKVSFSSGVDCAGRGPSVCQRGGVVHDVLHLHDLHPPGPPRRGVHCLRATARLHTGSYTADTGFLWGGSRG